jgi:hypothetical protein
MKGNTTDWLTMKAITTFCAMFMESLLVFQRSWFEGLAPLALGTEFGCQVFAEYCKIIVDWTSD